MPIENEAIEDIVFDKFAMESMAYDQLDIDFAGDTFFDKLDELVVKNVPGHFHGANWSVIPTATEIIDPLKTKELDIAVTPFGNADAPLGDQFAKPYLIKKPLAWLLNKIEHPDSKQYYFQSQDDNLKDIDCAAPKSLPFGSKFKFLGPQQAANLWIGTKGTTSRLHSDNYDNIYVQVSGSKRIYLMPPSSILDVKEKMLDPATYDENMQLVPDGEDSPPVLFPTYDPSVEPPKQNLLIVDLNPGDVLFLPALWYHQVEITSKDPNVSLNYWHAAFDDERRWASWNMSRQLTRLLQLN